MTIILKPPRYDYHGLLISRYTIITIYCPPLVRNMLPPPPPPPPPPPTHTHTHTPVLPVLGSGVAQPLPHTQIRAQTGNFVSKFTLCPFYCCVHSVKCSVLAWLTLGAGERRASRSCRKVAISFGMMEMVDPSSARCRYS